MKFTRYSHLVVFLASFLIYFISTEHLFTSVRFPTGDEPYYLLIAHSLVHDGDFELTNNFANRDYNAYYPIELTPRHEAITPKPILVSKHALGLPLLIAPAYALDGWFGAAHMLNLFGALLAVNIFLLASEVTGSEHIGWLMWAALAFAAPFFTYAELIFPEVPAALLIVYSYRQLRRWHQTNRTQQFLTVLCLAYLPWLHSRFLFVVFGLFVYLAYQFWQQRTPRTKSSLAPALLLFAPLLISAALLVAYDVYVYDSPLPNYGDHSGSGTPPEIVGALFGVWLDQQWGLLNHAPIYLLALLALRDWRLETRNSRPQFPVSNLKWLALITLPYFLLVVQYKYWWGEWCPPARYLTPILPLLTPSLALALQRITRARFRITMAALTLLGWGVGSAFALDGNLMFNHPLGASRLLVALGEKIGTDLTRFEPSYILLFLKLDDPTQWLVTQTVLTLVWLIALGALAWLACGPMLLPLSWRQRREPVTTTEATLLRTDVE